jgi:carboxyl-terminal processing protease
MFKLPVCCKKTCQMKPENRLLSLVVGAVLAIGVRQVPGHLIALNPSDVKTIERADKAIAQREWSRASDLLDELAVEPQDELAKHIQQQRRWCYANLTVKKRYSDPALADSNLSITVQQALQQLNEVIDLVEKKYYATVDYDDLLKQTLLQMNAVLDHGEIMRRYSVELVEINRLREKINAFNNFFALSGPGERKNIIDVALSLSQQKNSDNSGQSWPILEMSYAIAQSLDHYSHLLSPTQYQALQDRLQGFYFGIGVDIIQNEEYPIVFDVIASGPAKKVGIQPGDTLIRAGGKDLSGLSNEQIGEHLSAEKGSVVSLVVRRNQKEISIDVVCDIINAPSVRAIQTLENDRRVGYFRVSGFDRDTAMEMRRAVDLLIREGATSLMIDLRFNGGGMMTSAIDAVRLFMDQGIITTVQTVEKRSIYRAGGDGFTAYQLPLILLVDENTASAAEIFVAALKDQQRATVIGQKTFGKGLVQTIYHLKTSNSALCLTTASFVPPSNNSFHLSGITPDIFMENHSNESKKMFTLKKISDDPILQVALQRFLSQKTL